MRLCKQCQRKAPWRWPRPGTFPRPVQARPPSRSAPHRLLQTHVDTPVPCLPLCARPHAIFLRGQAGKASACAGCPNQQLCASGEAAKPDPAVAVIAQRLANVKHKILVLSGKGGVGKSTFSAQMALGLAGMDRQVGLLDIDICGPSQPTMMGVAGESVHQSSLGWCPVYPVDNLGVISIGFLLGNKDEAVVWRGPKKNGMIKQFLKDVHWGDALDFLVRASPLLLCLHTFSAQPRCERAPTRPDASTRSLSLTRCPSSSGTRSLIVHRGLRTSIYR